MMKKKNKQEYLSINSKRYFIQVLVSIVFVLLPAFGFIPFAEFLGLNIRWATAAIGIISILAGLEVMAWAKFDTFRWKPIFTRWQNIIGGYAR